MEVLLTYRGKRITTEDVVFIRQLIDQNPGDSRWVLSKKLCQAWGWRQPNGALRDMVCRGLMLGPGRSYCLACPKTGPAQSSGPAPEASPSHH